MIAQGHHHAAPRGAVPIKGDTVGQAAVYTIAVYLIGKMFYVLTGGNAQPADVALVVMALLVSPPSAVLRVAREWPAFALLVIWILIVNTGWAVMTGKTAFLVSSTYYIFNFLVVTATFSTRERHPALFDRVIPIALLASIAIQFAIVLVTGAGPGGRALGSFNNPNQLSYWALLAVSLLLVIRRNKTRLWDLPFLLMALWCQISGASRAGAVSIVLLLMAWAWFALETPIKRVVGSLFGAMMAVLFVLSPMGADIGGSDQLSTAEARLTKNEKQSQFEVRNYNRIVKYYQYTALGAGEGFLARFQDTGVNYVVEIHSSFGTMLFSYGVIGLALFLLVLASLFKRLPFSLGIYMVPVLIYGVTHQGLRFTFFWMLLGIMLSIAAEFRARRAAAPSAVEAGPLVKPFTPRRADYLMEIAKGRGGRY